MSLFFPVIVPDGAVRDLRRVQGVLLPRFIGKKARIIHGRASVYRFPLDAHILVSLIPRFFIHFGASLIRRLDLIIGDIWENSFVFTECYRVTIKDQARVRASSNFAL